MQSTLFISDLHLCDSRPNLSRLFLRFLAEIAPQSERLYILGDLFDYWIGDDDLDTPFHQEIAGALASLSSKGTAVFLMHGNRDFLLGERFARACGARLLADPSLIDLCGTPTLLMHGDTLCTDDLGYQQFRAQVREPAWQAGFLTKPLAERRAMVQALRRQSEQEKSRKPASIMDVAPATVVALLRQYRYPRLIHGHTHRPAKHLHQIDEQSCERWVLSDWHDDRSGYLRCDANGCVPAEILIS